jgi:hypothetical protein
VAHRSHPFIDFINKTAPLPRVSNPYVPPAETPTFDGGLKTPDPNQVGTGSVGTLNVTSVESMLYGAAAGAAATLLLGEACDNTLHS